MSPAAAAAMAVRPIAASRSPRHRRPASSRSKRSAKGKVRGPQRADSDWETVRL
jgi:hypothetical protein